MYIYIYAKIALAPTGVGPKSEIRLAQEARTLIAKMITTMSTITAIKNNHNNKNNNNHYSSNNNNNNNYYYYNNNNNNNNNKKWQQQLQQPCGRRLSEAC